jgi:hypothetical protein
VSCSCPCSTVPRSRLCNEFLLTLIALPDFQASRGNKGNPIRFSPCSSVKASRCRDDTFPEKHACRKLDRAVSGPTSRRRMIKLMASLIPIQGTSYGFARPASDVRERGLGGSMNRTPGRIAILPRWTAKIIDAAPRRFVSGFGAQIAGKPRVAVFRSPTHSKLEHFPAALNQGDSQLLLPRRIWRN